MINTYAFRIRKLFRIELLRYLGVIFFVLMPLPIGVFSVGELISLNDRVDYKLNNTYYMSGVEVYSNVNLIYMIGSLINSDRDVFINGYRKENNDKTLDISVHIAKYVAFTNDKFNFKELGPERFNISNEENESGPSGGLMMSLCFVEMIREVDYYGLRIAGTGEINAYGMVLPIGGVKYKTLAVNKSNIDIFFVPIANYMEARKYINNKVDLVKVGNLNDALQYLTKYDKINR